MRVDEKEGELRRRRENEGKEGELLRRMRGKGIKEKNLWE
jgi:hypothetical protein